MKLLLTLFLAAMTQVSLSQKIKSSKYDPFLKVHRIETNYVAIKQGLSNGLSIGYRSVDSTIFLILAGYGKATGVVGTDDRLIFLLQDESTIDAFSKGIQSYKVNQYQNTFIHEYRISLDNVAKLKTSKIIGLRKYNSDGYVDTEISSNNSKDINSISEVFHAEYLKKFSNKQ